MLSRPPVSLDIHLLRVSAMEEPRLKANCARALKNMTSDSTEAIEEGAVAALIAMSLEGKSKGNKVSDELAAPVIAPYKKDTAPACFDDSPDWANYVHVLPKMVAEGGESDTDIAHPAAPIVADANEEMAFPVEDLDGSEAEGRAKMAFAKMQVPVDVREQALLRDEDFNVKEEELDEGQDDGAAIQIDYETYDDNGDIILGGIGAASEEKKEDVAVSPSGSPKGSPKATLRKSSLGSAKSPKDVASPQSTPKGSGRKQMAAAAEEKKADVARESGDKGRGGGGGGKGKAGEKNMKIQAEQLGLYK